MELPEPSPLFRPVLQELADLQVCGICALRIAGVRSASAYLVAPGTARAWLQTVDAAAVSGSRKRKLGEDGQGDASEEACMEEEAASGSGSPRPGGAAAPCPLCLGILQALCTDAADGAHTRCCEFQLATTTSSLNSPGWWEAGAAGGPPNVVAHTAPCVSLAEAAAAVAEEWELGPFALEVCLPAAMTVRAQALLWRLQHELGRDALKAVGLLASERDGAPVGVKEAARLAFGLQLGQLLGQEQDQQSGLRISLTCSHAGTEGEAAWLAGQHLQRRGRGCGKQGGAQAQAATDALVQRLASMPHAEFEQACPASALQLVLPAGPAVIQVQAHRRAVFIGGRYLKLRRGIPQSPWFLDGQRRGESSVQEEIARRVLPLLAPDAYTFLSAGREDADVRMLGTGRPFTLEVHNARRGQPDAAACAAMEAAINAAGTGVQVRGLRAADAALVSRLKEGEQDKEKSYSALCWVPRALTHADVALLEGSAPLELQQQTPVRVLHRRANMTRARTVLHMRVERPSGTAGEDAAAGGAGQQGQYFLLHMRTEAGTYVKEFITGDMGRTRPSLGGLLGGIQAEIAALDVAEVHMDLLL